MSSTSGFPFTLLGAMQHGNMPCIALEVQPVHCSAVLQLLQSWVPTCRWLRKDKEIHLQEQKSLSSEKGSAQKAPPQAAWSNGWAAGRMTASMKDSSNAVMRM